MSNVHAFPCICSFYLLYLDIVLLLGTFFMVFFSLSLSSICISLLLWHPNANLLCAGTLFIPGYPLLLILHIFLFGSVIRRQNRTSLRTFPDKAFNLNSKSSCRTSPILTFPLSSTVGNGSHCVMSRSPIHPC